MTDGEIEDILSALRAFAGDTAQIEAKRASRGLPQRLWETLSAFANTPGGGVLLLGVDERAGFDPVGVDNAAKIQQDLASLCDQMDPPLRPLIGLHRFGSAVLVTAEVPELPFTQRPCYYRGAGLTNGAYIRVADGDRRLSPYEVSAMLSSRGQPHDDEAPVAEASLKDLDPALVALYLQRLRVGEGSPFRTRADEEALRATRVLVPHNGTLVPSLGGLLALGRYPQEYLPSLELLVVVYPTDRAGEPGPGGERFLDNRRLEGPLPTMVLGAVDALKRNMKRQAVVRGLLREDRWEYPEEALREALVNALAHRDYGPGARGTPVQVQLFPERLVVTNPGGLFGPVTVDRLGEGGLSAARNQTLLRILEDLPVPGERATLCENRGSGIGAMLAALRKAGMQPPVFDNSISSFRVVFPAHALLDQATLNWMAGFAPLRLSREQQSALAYVRRNGTITNLECRRLTGQDSVEVRRDLRLLVEGGLLRSLGAGRWTAYELATSGQSATTKPIPGTKQGPADRGEAILRLLREAGPTSRQEIAARIEVSPATALSWLNRLIAEGTVERTAPARSRHVRYQLTQSGRPGL